MKQTMIVVADSTRARIFTTESASSALNEIDVMVHPESREHDREITSDLPGKGTGVDSSAGHAFQGETDPKKHELVEFTRSISSYLENTRNANKLSRLLIVASPPVLGELRAHLSSSIKEKIVFELDKNLTQHSAVDIRDHLPKYLSH